MERWRKIYDALFVKKSGIVGKGLYTRVRIPKRAKVGTISQAQLRDIAEQKMKDLNANDLDAATKIIEGSAQAMGLTVVEG